MLALKGFVADTAHKAPLHVSGSTAAVLGQGREGMTLGALRSVVNVLDAHATMLVELFGCKVD